MGKRANPMAVKAALTYEIGEAATALGKSSATIRNWIKDGLPVMASRKPYLISGADIRTYIKAKSRAAKSTLAPDELYCLSCTHLRTEALFGPDDPLFPPAKVKAIDGAFKVVGLNREIYKNANAIREAIKEAFTRADLPPFTPHAFRKTLVKWADATYPTREAFKAFSQNIGHSSVITTISAYCPISTEQQGAMIKAGNSH